MEKPITMQEILEAINEASTRNQEHVFGLITELRQEINDRFDQVDQRFDRLEMGTDWIETNMATKGNIERLADVLRGRNIISGFDATYVRSPEPRY